MATSTLFTIDIISSSFTASHQLDDVTTDSYSFTTDSSDHATMASSGCSDESGSNCTLEVITHAPMDPLLCQRLAPPPVPPWMQSRVSNFTQHCRSWALYHGKWILKAAFHG